MHHYCSVHFAAESTQSFQLSQMFHKKHELKGKKDIGSESSTSKGELYFAQRNVLAGTTETRTDMRKRVVQKGFCQAKRLKTWFLRKETAKRKTGTRR
jgi:hypothetical protein